MVILHKDTVQAMRDEARSENLPEVALALEELLLRRELDSHFGTEGFIHCWVCAKGDRCLRAKALTDQLYRSRFLPDAPAGALAELATIS